MSGERPRPKNCQARIAKEAINDKPDRNKGGFCDELYLCCSYCSVENSKISASDPSRDKARSLARSRARTLRPCARIHGLLAPKSPF